MKKPDDVSKYMWNMFTSEFKEPLGFWTSEDGSLTSYVVMRCANPVNLFKECPSTDFIKDWTRGKVAIKEKYLIREWVGHEFYECSGRIGKVWRVVDYETPFPVYELDLVDEMDKLREAKEMKKTTKAQFKQFKTEFMRCVEVLGLKDWKVYIDIGKVEDGYAQIVSDYEGMTSTVTMAEELKNEDIFDAFDPIVTAKHEAIHLLIQPLVSLARWRYVEPDQITVELERICTRMEKLLIKEKK